MLFLLLAGHALMDFSLQGDAMASCKCRRANLPLQQAVPWYYWLIAHAMLHGLAVTVIIRWLGCDMNLAVQLGLAETAAHALIDTMKCEKLFNIQVDQLLHVMCKVAWWIVATGGSLWI